MTPSMIELYHSARVVGVPIVIVRTSDQAEAIAEMAAKSADQALFQWDAVEGLTGLNKIGQQAMTNPKLNLGGNTVGFVDALFKAPNLPQGSVLFCHNAHRQLMSAEPLAVAASVQAVANLRDKFKMNFRMLVMLGPTFTVPVELEQDVVVLDQALPTPAQLRELVKEIQGSAKKNSPSLPDLTEAQLDKAVDAVSGLSNFAAEQVIAMSFTANGLNLDNLWERKRVAIEQTRGLSVYRGGDTFADLEGLEAIKAKLRARKNVKKPIRVVVWIDEGADVFANVEHDTSGVKTDQQRALLVEMENMNWKGIILTGMAGTGKSAIARAFGNELGVPTIALDFGDMEAPHVGESEAYLRQAIKTIKAVAADGDVFFMLTCNSLQGIRPQFMRRFKKGVYFFDVSSKAEREKIWALYEKKYNIKKQARPNDEGWNGAEIRECCEEADETGITLVQAAQSIIPVSRSRADVYEQMRKEAHGRFLDAAAPGHYQYKAEPMEKQVRAIKLGDAVMGAALGTALTKES